MPNPLRLLGQGVLYAAFVALLGYFATAPAYQHIDSENAMIRVSFTHASARLVECRRLSVEEIAAMPPQERRPLAKCPRGRAPLLLELTLDGTPLYQRTLQPSGLSRDGSINAYAKFEVPSGEHELTIRMRDTPREEGFDYEYNAKIMVRPGQNLIIDFHPETSGFVIL